MQIENLNTQTVMDNDRDCNSFTDVLGWRD